MRAAEKVGRATLDGRSRVLGPEHPATLKAMVNLATSLLHQGQYVEAEKLLRDALSSQRRVLGPSHPNVGASLYQLAVLKGLQGKNDEALTLLRESIDHGLPPDDTLGIETDPDLKPLRGDPRFTALIAEASKRAAAAPGKRTD